MNFLKIRNTSSVDILGGEYPSLKDALDFCSEYDNIIIHAGTYSSVENDYLPENCTITGVGNVTIDATNTNDASDAEITNISALNVRSSFVLKNLTFSCKNARYAIHDDYSIGDGIKRVYNCKFIHYGNEDAYNYRIANDPGTEDNVFRACSAYGGGTNSGDNVLIEDCYFESNIRGFSMHDNVDFETSNGASSVVLRNCNSISNGIDTDGTNLGFVIPYHYLGLPSGALSSMTFENCTSNGAIVLDGTLENTRIYGDFKNQLMVFNTAGSGLTMNDTSSTKDTDYYMVNPTEMQNFKNLGADILKGQAIKKSSYGFELFTSSDVATDFYGVALENINASNSGMIKHSGFLHKIYMSGLTTTLVEGDDIYVGASGDFNTTSGVIVTTAVSNQNVLIG